MIKKIIAVCLVLVPAFSFANNDGFSMPSGYQVEQDISIELEHVLNEVGNVINSNGSSHIYTKKNTDVSKIEALKGTWIVSYKIGTKVHTDKIVIDTIHTASDGEKEGKGLLYLNQTGSGMLILCGYDPVTFAFLNSDYLCLSNLGTYDTYNFKFTGNTIVSGFYLEGLFSPTKSPLTGYRVDSAYNSNYQTISWSKRDSDNDYCLDIADDNGNLYDGMHPLQCGKDMLNFSPIDYVHNVMHGELPNGFAFRWKIWSRNANAQGQTIGNPNYAGAGYEGRVVVGQ